MTWKQVDIWKLFYIWITYIVPQFRYGALLFMEEEYMEDEKEFKQT